MTPEEKRARQREYYHKWYENNKERARKMKRERMREYRAANPEKHLRQTKEAKQRMRNALFEIYGEVCALCGFSDKRVLTLDHIKNNGSEERAELGERGVYQRAKDNYLPDEYRILCMNCQFICCIEAGRQNAIS